MGSSFSVVNDTDKPIWVSHGVCKAALFGAIGGVLAVAAAGAGAAVAAGAAAAAAGGGVIVGAIEGVVMAPVIAGFSPAFWSAFGSVSSFLAAGSGIAAGLDGEEREKVMSAKKELEKILEDYTRVEPGKRYKVDGTLSLVLTTKVIFDDGKMAKNDCFTGPTDGSDNEYLVTKHF